MRSETDGVPEIESEVLEMGDANTRRPDTGGGQLTREEVERLFNGAYRDIEILPDGTLRETTRGGDPQDDNVTRTLKTERTWY